MAEPVFKKIELVGTSTESFSAAAANAIAKANESIRKMRWFEVVEQRGSVEDGKIGQFQVTLRVAFHVE